MTDFTECRARQIPKPQGRSIPIVVFTYGCATMVKSKRLTTTQRREIGTLDLATTEVSKIARRYNITRETVRHWLAEGRKLHPNYSDAPGRGRKPDLTTSQKSKIRKKARQGHTAEEIGKQLSQQGVKGASATNIRRLLKSGKNPLHYVPVERGKVLSAVNKGRRVQFCEAHKDFDFSTCIFLDAKDLYLYKDEYGRMAKAWQSMEKGLKLADSNPWVFRFYAAIAHGHKSKLYFVAPSPKEGTLAHHSTEKFDAQGYINMMTDMAEEVRHWFPAQAHSQLIQDNAKQHTANKSKQAVKGMGLTVMSDWPPQSWDLNVIENCWGVLDDYLHLAKATSTDGWFKIIRAAWDKVDQRTIDRLVRGMHGRVQEVREAGGEWVKHH